MAGGWKKTLFKVLLGLHIVLLPVAVLMWGKGYLALACHLHEGVLYEITSILSPYRWHLGRHIGLLETIFWPSGENLFPLKTEAIEALHVGSARDPSETGFTDLVFIWGGTIEEQLRAIQPPEVIGSLVWVEGVKRKGNKEPTLIAYGKAEIEGEWNFFDDHLLPAQQRPPFYGTAFFSQKIYNLNRLWLVFYSLREAEGEQVWPGLGSGITPMRMHHKNVRHLVVHASLSEKWAPKPVTPTEIIGRISAYRPGVMPIGYRLRVLSAMPGETWFWIPRGFHETLFLIIHAGLAVATPLYRILFYLPLLLVPRILVWPVAILWAILWMAGWAWSIAIYRRLRS